MTDQPARLPFPVTRTLPDPFLLRAEDGDEKPMLRGQFTTFDDPYEVHSHIEGRFIERMAPGAFDRTVVESRRNIKPLFNHGMDPTMGEQIIGDIVDLRGTAHYVIDPFDGLPPLLRSGLEAGAYGSSHRFSVIADEWDYSPKRSAYNPEALPERTITEARLYEFGPVTFPANPNATAGIRSSTDDYYQQGGDYESVLRSAQAARAGSPQTDAELPRSPEPDASPDEPTPEEDPRSSEVDYVTIEDKQARYDELNASIELRAEAAQGRLPEEERVAFDADVLERDELRADLEEVKRMRSLIITGGGVDTKVERPAWTPPADRQQVRRKSESELHSPESWATTLEGRAAEFRDDAKRILDRASFPAELTTRSASGDRITDLLDHHDSADGELARRIKYTGSPVYMRAFEKIIKAKGSTIGLTPEEQRGTALAVGVDATGGFTVPFAFDPTIIAIGSWSGAVNPYRRACRVVSIVGTDTWNAITSTAVVATRTTEAAASVEQGPTFAQPQYIVTRVQGQITASFEMFQDRSDLASEMSVLIAEAKDNEEEAAFATSASGVIGVGPVQGTSGAFTAVDTAGASLVAADLDTLEAAVPVRHRFNAQWFMNRANIRRIQALETTGGKLFGGSQYPAVGNPAVDGAGNTGLRLLGYPVNESPSLPTSTATNIVIATLANVSQYVIVDRIGLSVQFIPFILNSSALATGQQALYFMYRNTAKPINVDGGRTLQYV